MSEPNTNNLKLIAENRIDTPLSEWPDHNSYHRRTLLKNWLWDENCLRCWLEELAGERLRAQKKEV